MSINSKNLLGLPVLTKSGDYLGRVSGFELDETSGKITQYLVARIYIMGLIKSGELLINETQVISITKEKMVVADTLIKAEEKDKQTVRSPIEVEKIEPVISSERQ